MSVTRAFTGGGLVSIRIRNTPYSILVEFGEIRLPRIEKLLDKQRREELEEKYGCRIIDAESYIAVIPDIVGEIIERDGALATCDEHRRLLSGWLERNFRPLLRDVFAP